MVNPVKNQYCGINAHLHSLWQAHSGWHEFHTAHINDLMRLMKAQLLPMGYTAAMEPSIQIRRLEGDFDEPEADVAIYETGLGRPAVTVAERLPGRRRMPVTELIPERPLSERPFRAVQIYEVKSDRRGAPVAWIELLSPTNKGQSEDAGDYQLKRLKLLRGGVVFVELDYLHETPSTFPGILRYRMARRKTFTPGAHPYRLVVIDPRPKYEKSEGEIDEFDVDEPIPTIDIPLNAGDILRFDFDAAYQKTLEETLFAYENVDYRRLPVNFDRYSPSDRARIVSRMLAVLEAARRGNNLERPPQPIETIPLEEGLKRLGEYGVQ